MHTPRFFRQLTLAFSLGLTCAQANEGMWMPSQIPLLRAQLEALGCAIKADKDAGRR